MLCVSNRNKNLVTPLASGKICQQVYCIININEIQLQLYELNKPDNITTSATGKSQLRVKKRYKNHLNNVHIKQELKKKRNNGKSQKILTKRIF